MRIWWVNHKQTWKQEFEGGYIWAPKRKSDGSSSKFYDNLKEVRPGDLVLSYAFAALQGVGVVKSIALDAPMPDELNGFNWNQSGWKVEVDFQAYEQPFRMKDFCIMNYDLFPAKYSPMNSKGVGNQGCYLAEISAALYSKIEELVSLKDELNLVAEESSEYTAEKELNSQENFFEKKEQWETAIEEELSTQDISSTEFEQLVKSRRGQGKFRKNVLSIETQCRLTHIDQAQFLVASHIKPWRHCMTSEERLSAENGLMLTPTIDFLFDRGFISFDNGGDLLISKALDDSILRKLHLEACNTGSYTEGQKYFLEAHRKDIFLT